MNISLHLSDIRLFRHLSNHSFTSSQIIALSFAIAIAFGTFLLLLPLSYAPGHPISVIDALFTATSALCVTGLTVVDTGKDYSRFGQVMIMLLVQIGGLGIVTLGTLGAILTGRRIGYRERLNLQAQVNSLQVGGVVKLLRRIAILVFGVELIGSLLLFWRFWAMEGTSEGAFFALFHSISAFNNAGFGLYSDNLMRFVGDPLINFTIMALIIMGGLGFIVQIDVLSYYRRRNGRKPLLLHSKMVLVATAFLIIAGALVILLFEWTNPTTLQPLTLPQRIIASLFQAVTPRTAGFNTLDYAHLRDGTLIFTMLLMFIGGSPGSTAGGIKTVTFFTLIGSAWSISRGHGEFMVFGRRLSMESTIRAGSIALIAMVVLGAAITLLTFTDPQFSSLALGFEAVSAFGTVGLSTGITAKLSIMGKLLLILLMYLGRIGPLTMTLALVEKSAQDHIHYPTEDIVIG